MPNSALASRHGRRGRDSRSRQANRDKSNQNAASTRRAKANKQDETLHQTTYGHRTDTQQTCNGHGTSAYKRVIAKSGRERQGSTTTRQQEEKEKQKAEREREREEGTTKNRKHDEHGHQIRQAMPKATKCWSLSPTIRHL